MCMNFLGKFLFPSKVPEFLHVLSNLVVKHSPVIFLAGLHFVSEKNEGKISKWATMNATKRNKRKSLFTFSPPDYCMLTWRR